MQVRCLPLEITRTDVARTDESRPICGRFMSHTQMQVQRWLRLETKRADMVGMDESRHTCECVISHIPVQVQRRLRLERLCTLIWHVRMSHVTHVNESCHTCICRYNDGCGSRLYALIWRVCLLICTRLRYGVCVYAGQRKRARTHTHIRLDVARMPLALFAAAVGCI